MAVRNFWIEADVDGRKTQLSGGPRNRDGGFTLTVYVRQDGGIARALWIEGYAKEDGTLLLGAAACSDVELVSEDTHIQVRSNR